jgi:Spy/CpxP family protein refolding chaperone
MTTSRWTKVLGILPLVALAGLSACTTQAGDTDETGAASGKIESPAGAPGFRHGRPGAHGPAGLLFAALHELDLTAAQRATIEGALKELHEGKGPPDKVAFEAQRTALAAQVRSGKIDKSALSFPAHKGPPDPARMAKAVQTLHDTLTPAQRKELVTAMGEKGHGPGAEPGEHPGPKGGPLQHLLADLSVTDAQRAQIEEGLAKVMPAKPDREAMKAKHEAMRAEMKARLQAFAADKLDAAAFAAPPKDAPQHMRGPEHMIDALAVIVPILTDAQRAELAKRIEQGPGPGMGPGHMRPRH